MSKDATAKMEHGAGHRFFNWRIVLVTLLLAVVTGVTVNGPVIGTAYLKELVPGVTIPDLTAFYSPDELPGFFQAMGGPGREAYLTINNLDFLFIISYSLFGVAAIGTMLRYLMKHTDRATRLAFLGLLPGTLDTLESICLRVIVNNPFAEHATLSQAAAILTTVKIVAINLALVSVLVLAIVTLVTWRKQRSKIVT